MIVIVLVLLVGMLCGAALADRLCHAAVSRASRRALAQLECVRDGLQRAYAMDAALLETQRELAALAAPADGPPDLAVHLPPRRGAAAGAPPRTTYADRSSRAGGSVG